MEYLVDTSVLVRQADLRSADRAIALASLAGLKSRSDDLILAKHG